MSPVLSGSARALFIAGFWQTLRRPLIVVTPQDRGVETLATDISYFHGELNANADNRVVPFPAWETDPYAGLTPHADIQQTRATTLWRSDTSRPISLWPRSVPWRRGSPRRPSSTPTACTSARR